MLLRGVAVVVEQSLVQGHQNRVVHQNALGGAGRMSEHIHPFLLQHLHQVSEITFDSHADAPVHDGVHMSGVGTEVLFQLLFAHLLVRREGDSCRHFCQRVEVLARPFQKGAENIDKFGGVLWLQALGQGNGHAERITLGWLLVASNEEQSGQQHDEVKMFHKPME